jgi:hypothetical protein
MLPPDCTDELAWSTPYFVTSGFPPVSKKVVRNIIEVRSSAMTPSRTQPCLGWPSIRPNMTGKANGMSNSR